MASLLLNLGRVALATRVVPRVVAGLAPRAGRAVIFGLGPADFRQPFVYDWHLSCRARDRVFPCIKNFQTVISPHRVAVLPNAPEIAPLVLLLRGAWMSTSWRAPSIPKLLLK
jgi:hypothetical protein